MDFARAMEMLADRRFAPAAELLERVGGVLYGDRATNIYLTLARKLAADPPAGDWQGLDINSDGVVSIAAPWG